MEGFIFIQGIIFDNMEHTEKGCKSEFNISISDGFSLQRVELVFEPGAFVLHPLHGIGRIEKFENKEILGQSCEFAVISFQNDKLRIMVNLNQKESMFRNLISNEDIPVVLSYIKSFESEIPLKSTDRYNLNMKKIKSADILMLAQVIKDLTSLGRVKKLTPKELDMLKQSKKTMATEFAFVSSIPIEDAETMLEESCRVA